MEIVVVDNASTDGSGRMVQEEFREVVLIEPGQNTGYARGNNLAFSAAHGEWLLTLNPDTEVQAGALDAALEVLNRDPRAGCVGVRLVGTDGRVQQSVRGFPSFVGILGDVLRLRCGPFDSYRLSRFDYEREQPAPQPMGTFLLFRREALESIGDPKRPFDEAFPIFFNEVDLLYRLQQAGWTCIYTPRASVVHLGGQSTKQVRKNMIWESHRSLVRFLRKHSGTASQVIGLLLLAPVIYVAAFIRARGYYAGFRT
jgi:hypothetical protein